MMCERWAPWALLCLVGVSSGAAEAPQNGAVRLVLPAAIDAVPGFELNVYFDNVMLALNPADYSIDVTCDKGLQQAERWTFTPKPEDVGTFTLRLDVLDKTNTVVARGATSIRVAPRDAGKGRAASLLCIGDSLTHASVYTLHLLTSCDQPDNPVLSLIGTNGPGNEPGLNRHEGYGGWTAKHFVTHFTGAARGGEYAKRGSPFLYAGDGGTPKLDFARYCAETNGGKAPDFVSIFLGPNDIAWATDENIEAMTTEMLSNLELLVANIRAFGLKTKIGVLPPTPPCASQDGFGAAYGCGISRWQYRRNQHRAVERLIERFGGKEADGLYIVAAYANLDCVHGYPQISVAANARTSEKVARYADSVHPTEGGYRQIGDAIYTWMKGAMPQP